MGPYNWWIHIRVTRVSLTMHKTMTHIIFCNFLNLLYMILVINQCDVRKNFLSFKFIHSNVIWNYILYYEYKSSIRLNCHVLDFFFFFHLKFCLFYKESQVNTWPVVIDGKKKNLDRGFIFQCCMHNCLDCICLVHPKGK